MKKNRVKKSHLNKKSDRQLLLMSIPSLLKIFIFSYIPMAGIVIAFQNYKPRTGFFSEFVGMANFKYLISSPSFYDILFNTILLNLLFIFAGLVVSVLLGVFMFEISRPLYLKAAQTAMFFPYFVSWTVAALILVSLLDSQGLITSIVAKITGENIQFYMESKYWRLILVLSNIWKSAGVNAIIYYATLMGADQSIYEAAQIDGANRFQRMVYISIPHLKTMIMIMTIMSFGNILHTDFNMIFYLTKGSGALYSTTDVIDTYVYRIFRTGGNFSVSAAAGLIQSVAGLVLSVIVNKISRKIEPKSALF